MSKYSISVNDLVSVFNSISILWDRLYRIDTDNTIGNRAITKLYSYKDSLCEVEKNYLDWLVGDEFEYDSYRIEVKNSRQYKTIINDKEKLTTAIIHLVLVYDKDTYSLTPKTKVINNLFEEHPKTIYIITSAKMFKCRFTGEHAINDALKYYDSLMDTVLRLLLDTETFKPSDRLTIEPLIKLFDYILMTYILGDLNYEFINTFLFDKNKKIEDCVKYYASTIVADNHYTIYRHFDNDKILSVDIHNYILEYMMIKSRGLKQ